MHHTMNGPSPIVRQAAEFSSVNATQANDPLHPGAGKLISHLRNARGRINANGLSGHGDVLHRIIESIDLDDIDELPPGLNATGSLDRITMPRPSGWPKNR